MKGKPVKGSFMDKVYPSGNTYSGEWKTNQRHGKGMMRWLNLGQMYVGAWQDGVQHGQGTHVWNLRRKDGSQYSQSNRYTGEFAQGQRHGWGTFYYAGGAIYEGEWKNNKKHGKLFYSSKNVKNHFFCFVFLNIKKCKKLLNQVKNKHFFTFFSLFTKY
uniref:MORN repeat containing 3 n=1 Tax=Pundamilia nyererei TaxID=303518 RepID=A0A3B4GT09_9CICH